MRGLLVAALVALVVALPVAPAAPETGILIPGALPDGPSLEAGQTCLTAGVVCATASVGFSASCDWSGSTWRCPFTTVRTLAGRSLFAVGVSQLENDERASYASCLWLPTLSPAGFGCTASYTSTGVIDIPPGHYAYGGFSATGGAYTLTGGATTVNQNRIQNSPAYAIASGGVSVTIYHGLQPSTYYW